MRAVKELEKELEVDAFARDFQTKIATGTLAAIDNQVDAATGTVRLKARFENKDHALFPNQFVNARLGVETIADTVLVPSAAVQRGPDFTYVYVVKEDSTVELRKITTGPTEGDETSVISGLAAGEIVVIDGVDKLQDNTKVMAHEKKSAGDVKQLPSRSTEEERPSRTPTEARSDGAGQTDRNAKGGG